MDNETRHVFSENLNRLVRQHGNIAHVCRRLGINRQQFNKYLAGQHIPSQVNMNAICDYFRVTYRDITSPDLKIPELRHPADYLGGFRDFEGAALLQEVVRRNEEKRLGSFAGTYLKYHYSSIYRGDIVRAVTVIEKNVDLFGYTNLERFPNKNRTTRHDYVFKYHGFVFMLDGRLFMADLEKMQKNEITFSIYAPIARNPVRFFFGVTGGVASNLYREPYASRSVLEYISPEPPTREQYKLATVVAPDDPSIPVEAIEYLNS
jgi:transcriptional regulator with XRE-family HTH domain